MRRIMLLAVFFVSLWCGSVFANQQVQLDDDRALYDIVEQYNNLTVKMMGNTIDTINNRKFINSFIRTNDVIIPQTTTYKTITLMSNTHLFASVNENGKVVGLLLVVPNTFSSDYCVSDTARLLKVLDSKMNFADIQSVCYNSFKQQNDNAIHSSRNNRDYIVRGCNMKDRYRLFITAVAR